MPPQLTKPLPSPRTPDGASRGVRRMPLPLTALIGLIVALTTCAPAESGKEPLAAVGQTKSPQAGGNPTVSFEERLLLDIPREFNEIGLVVFSPDGRQVAYTAGLRPSGYPSSARTAGRSRTARRWGMKSSSSWTVNGGRRSRPSGSLFLIPTARDWLTGRSGGESSGGK